MRLVGVGGASPIGDSESKGDDANGQESSRLRGPGVGAASDDEAGAGLARQGVGAAPSLPFGPYRSLPVDQVAVMDPAYLAGLIKAEVGPATLRAAAARALLTEGLYAPGEMVSTPAAPRPWAILLGLGLAAALVLGLAERLDLAGVAQGLRGTGPAAPAVRAAGPPAGQSPGTVTDGPRSTASGSRQTATTPSAPPPEATATPADACVARVPGAIAAAAAADYLDTFQAVAYHVVGTKDTGKVTFLNSRVPYNGHFYVAIFPTLYDQFPRPPAIHFRDQCIVVQGQIELYRGTAQIVVRSTDDIRLVEGP